MAALFIVRNKTAVFLYGSRDGTPSSSPSHSSSTPHTHMNIVAKTSSSFDPKDSDFELAKRESLGFFDDVSSHHWNLLKEKVKYMSPNYDKWYLPHGNGMKDKQDKKINDNRNSKPGYFYQKSYEPDFVCQHERRIGKNGDGGKWICDPHRISSQDDCLVYSIGSNNDFSFETAVLKDIGQHCEIHTFDFGNYSEGAKNVGYRLHNGMNETAVTYHQYGLGLEQPPKFKSLQSIVKELGHEKRTIDIFKVDCEGCEWTTAQHWFEANVVLRQIQIELHKSDVIKTPRFFDLIYANNYVITHKEPNVAYTGPTDLAIEYALLKLAPEFHAGYDRPKGATE